MRYNALGFRVNEEGRNVFHRLLLNQHLRCHFTSALSFQVNQFLWAARQEVYCSWQGTWVSNYQIPDLIAITWTPRQSELLEKNVISEAGTSLPTPCLDTSTKESPGKSASVETVHQPRKTVLKVNDVWHSSAWNPEAGAVLTVFTVCFVIGCGECVCVLQDWMIIWSRSNYYLNTSVT